ncbi:MAG: DUF1802 family protein [Akkermansiaceae bacterium]|jgi:hypothetical protein|tara:strand:- start:12654 stop:13124 length:471 start_codon:yes stop_codon:yes gene_type:complete
MIAFKEWDVVCQALEEGGQALILRKGGIHEGREGFSFAHEEFVLFPTRFHAQGDYVKVPDVVAKPEWEVGEVVVITSKVKVTKALTLTNWEDVAALNGQHIWTEETIRDRFFWEGKGMASGSIHVAYVEVEKLEEPIKFPYSKKYGGCRSWVELEL